MTRSTTILESIPFPFFPALAYQRFRLIAFGKINGCVGFVNKLNLLAATRTYFIQTDPTGPLFCAPYTIHAFLLKNCHSPWIASLRNGNFALFRNKTPEQIVWTQFYFVDRRTSFSFIYIYSQIASSPLRAIFNEVSQHKNEFGGRYTSKLIFISLVWLQLLFVIEKNVLSWQE